MAGTQVKTVATALIQATFIPAPLQYRLYETLYDLNWGFVLTLECFERLERLAFFRRDYLRVFHNMADELRARTNYEMTETLRDREATGIGPVWPSSREVESFQAPPHNVAKLKPFYR